MSPVAPFKSFIAELDRRGITGEERERQVMAKREQLKLASTPRDLVGEMVRNRRAGQERLSQASPLAGAIASRVVSPGITAAANFADTATFGAAPSIVAGATSPLVAAFGPESLGEAFDRIKSETDARIEASKQIDPKAAFIGQLGGFFRGPLGIATGAGGIIGQRTGALLARNLPRVATTAAASGGLSFSRRAAAQFIEAMTTSSGAILASQVLKDSLDRDETMGDALREAADLVRSPTNFALNAGIGIVGGAFRHQPDTVFIDLVRRLRMRVPNLRLSAFEFQSPEVMSFGGSLSRVPGGRGMIKRFLSENFFGPITRATNELRASFLGGRTPDQASQLAATRIKRLVGKAQPGEFGSIAQRRRTFQEDLFQQFGPQQVSDDMVRLAARGLDAFDQIRRNIRHTEGFRSGEMRKAVDSVGRMIRLMNRERQQGRPGRATIQQIWNLKTQFDNVAKWAQEARAMGMQAAGRDFISKADVREARQMSFLLRQALRIESPQFDRGIRTLGILRRIEKSLDPVVKAVKGDTPEAVLEAMMKPQFIARRLATFQRADPIGHQAFMGHYMGKFMEKVLASRDAVSGEKAALAKTMEREFNGRGIFRKEMFDRVLGSEMRQYFNDVAAVTDRMGQGIGASLGSPTAGTVADAMLVGFGVRAPQMVFDAITDTRAGLSIFSKTILVGGAVMWLNMIRSALGGKISEQLIRLSTGQRLAVSGRGAAVFQEAKTEGLESLSGGVRSAAAGATLADEALGLPFTLIDQATK